MFAAHKKSIVVKAIANETSKLHPLYWSTYYYFLENHQISQFFIMIFL
jgi:hypothetical protein